ncbi:MAG: hypothetical protein GY779_16070 [Gammaproteobacteria bacterium]|nr:hypothetical protein [Gammaproteobacteria bacterium]
MIVSLQEAAGEGEHAPGRRGWEQGWERWEGTSRGSWEEAPAIGWPGASGGSVQAVHAIIIIIIVALLM